MLLCYYILSQLPTKVRKRDREPFFFFFNHPILFFLQNYLTESLKYLDKAYPSAGSSISTSSAVSVASAEAMNTSLDTKPIYIDTKALLGHHMPHQSSDKKWWSWWATSQAKSNPPPPFSSKLGRFKQLSLVRGGKTTTLFCFCRKNWKSQKVWMNVCACERVDDKHHDLCTTTIFTIFSPVSVCYR